MNRRWLLLGILLLGVAVPALAHRLDQYLQATVLSLTRNEVTLQLRLTPGIAVAGNVLRLMGSADDKPIDEAARLAYAQQVRQDLSLSLDGNPVPLKLTGSSFASPAALRSGLGDITFTFAASAPLSNATHHLKVVNHHQQAMAAYLVNCLLPADPGIQVLAQRRSLDQSAYELDFAVGGVAAAGSATGEYRFATQDGWAVIGAYFAHGVHHILTGYDHLLFAAALVLAVTTVWELVKVVTVFTLAHSLTLALAALGLVHLPGSIVEPVIAASIVFVGLQNVLWPERAHGYGRLAVAFIFGLFHGLGFAGGLLDLMHHMPHQTVLLAILGFSLGVEAGHQLVLLPLFGALKVMCRPTRRDAIEARVARLIRRTGSAAIAAAGMVYLGAALVSCFESAA